MVHKSWTWKGDWVYKRFF